ncbi:MAG: hypothetical protein F4Y02_12215 [Chloroflexi bacterium]|nr:hypothetical protein [Chloroflexota bacterium]
MIVLAVISLAVGGAALGLALARGGSADTAARVVAQIENERSKAKADSRVSERDHDKRVNDRSAHAERRRSGDRYERSKDSRGRYHDWWGSRRVIVVPRIEVSPREFFRGDSPSMRRFERVAPERQGVRAGGMVIAVGEVTAVRNGVIEMFTMLGNEVTIDLSQLEAGIMPEVGAAAIVIAERDGDGYVARSMDLLDVRLSEMLEGMRARSRSGS